MERPGMLREQASILRTLARSVDVRAIRDRLLEIARRCDELAQSMEENPPSAARIPSGFPPDLH